MFGTVAVRCGTDNSSSRDGEHQQEPAGHNRLYAFALNLRGVCFACGHTADWGHVPVPRLSADLHPE